MSPNSRSFQWPTIGRRASKSASSHQTSSQVNPLPPAEFVQRIYGNQAISRSVGGDDERKSDFNASHAAAHLRAVGASRLFSPSAESTPDLGAHDPFFLRGHAQSQSNPGVIQQGGLTGATSLIQRLPSGKKLMKDVTAQAEEDEWINQPWTDGKGRVKPKKFVETKKQINEHKEFLDRIVGYLDSYNVLEKKGVKRLDGLARERLVVLQSLDSTLDDWLYNFRVFRFNNTNDDDSFEDMLIGDNKHEKVSFRDVISQLGRDVTREKEKVSDLIIAHTNPQATPNGDTGGDTGGTRGPTVMYERDVRVETTNMLPSGKAFLGELKLGRFARGKSVDRMREFAKILDTLRHEKIQNVSLEKRIGLLDRFMEELDILALKKDVKSGQTIALMQLKGLIGAENARLTDIRNGKYSRGYGGVDRGARRNDNDSKSKDSKTTSVEEDDEKKQTTSESSQPSDLVGGSTTGDIDDVKQTLDGDGGFLLDVSMGDQKGFTLTQDEEEYSPGPDKKMTFGSWRQRRRNKVR